VFWLDKRHIRAHRVAFKIANGYLPSEGVIRHLCGSRSCVNPSHLAHGTGKDNHNDSIRHGTVHFVKPESLERHALAVLKNAEVIEMRELHKRGERISAIARMYGKKYTTVWAAVHGQNFSALEREKQDGDKATDRQRDQS